MGFMAGFGAAFSDSFNRANEHRAQEEQDMFRLTYADYISQRDKRQEERLEDQKNVRLAKALTESYGHPAEAWTKAHELLRNGADESTVKEFLESNQLIVGPKTASAPAAPIAGQGQPQPSPMQEQMAGSGMSPGVPPQQPEQPAEEEKGSGFSGLLGGMFDKDQQRKRKREEAMGKIASTTGQDIESVRAVLEGTDYTPESLSGQENYQVTIKPKNQASADKVSNLNEALTFQTLAQQHFEETGDDSQLKIANSLVEAQKTAVFVMAKAKADAEGLTYTPSGVVLIGKDGRPFDFAPAIKLEDGRWRNTATGAIIEPDGENIAEVRPMTKTQDTQIAEIYEKTGKQSEAYNEKILNLQNTAALSEQMLGIVKDFPGSIGLAGKVAQWIDRTGRNVMGIKDLVTTQSDIVDKAINAGGSGYTADGLSALQDLENRMQEVIGGNIQDNAVATALLESKAIRMTYAWAAMQNQEGRAVSNEEFNKFYQSVLANGNPTAFRKEQSDILDESMRNLRREGDNLTKNNAAVYRFEKQHGFRPGAIVRPIDEILAEDPQMLERINKIIAGGKGVMPETEDNGLVEQVLGAPATSEVPAQTAPTQEGLIPIGKTPDGRIIYQNPETGEKGTME